MVVEYSNLEIQQPNSLIIDGGSKEQLVIIGYARSYLKTLAFHCVALLCLGLPYVLTHWHNVFGIRWCYVRCPIDSAQVLVLKVFSLYYFILMLTFMTLFSFYRMSMGRLTLLKSIRSKLGPVFLMNTPSRLVLLNQTKRQARGQD